MSEVSQFVHPKDWTHDRERPVVPPDMHYNRAGTHWLQIIDFDGHPGGHIALQWQPVSKAWCRSDGHARGEDIDTRGWKYISPIPLWIDQNELKLVKTIVDSCDAGLTSGIVFSDEELKFMLHHFEQLLV